MASILTVLLFQQFVDLTVPCIGASGAVCAILGATFYINIPKPLFLMLAALIALEIVKSLMGVVDKDSRGRLVPNNLDFEIPLLGLVEAGFPTTIDEQMTETISLDNYLIRDKNTSYLLEVKGDSMIDAGIQEGDLVIVERKGEPKIGDIVIAEVDGGWTMKYFRKKGSTVYLEPANKDYKPIFPVHQLRIAAIVRGVIRKY
jgi:repressor LexA